jgi:hypothetical protein
MTASDLLAALQECGATVDVDGDELVVRASRGALSAEVRAALVQLKPALLAELKQRYTPDNIDELTESVGEQTGSPKRLQPIHDAVDPWSKPTAPCMVCGRVHWRVWSYDGGESWQWICNGCRPLVVIHRDGKRWPQ